MSIRDKKCIFPEYALSGGTGYSDVVDAGDAGDAYEALWLVVRGTDAGAADTEQARLRLPLGCKRYLRMKYTATGTFTAGKVEAYLTPDIDM